MRQHVVSVPQRAPEHGRGAGSSVGVEPRGSSYSRLMARCAGAPTRRPSSGGKSKRYRCASRSGWGGVTRTPRGRERRPRTVARSQAGEDRTTTRRWRARTRTVRSRRERRVSPAVILRERRRMTSVWLSDDEELVEEPVTARRWTRRSSSERLGQIAARKASGRTGGAARSPHWDPRLWRGALAGSHSPARGTLRVLPLGGRATTVRAPLPLGYLPIPGFFWGFREFRVFSSSNG